jgi:hypothetical protein
MVGIPTLRWIESSSTAILHQENPTAPEIWHSGRAIDLLHLGNNRLLVGTDTGGLWLAEPNGRARPLSGDWEHPDVLCVTRRLDNPNAFLCGTRGGLYLNVPSAPDPLGTWVRAPLPPHVNAVYRVVTLDPGWTVIATNEGIWYAEHGTSVDITWHQAEWERSPGHIVPLRNSWSGLARTGHRKLAAGTQVHPTEAHHGIAGPLHPVVRPLVWGQFDGSTLVFRTATVTGIAPGEPREMRYISIGSCEAIANRVYAATFHAAIVVENGKLESSTARVFHLLRSDNGGETWAPVPTWLTGGPHIDEDLKSMAGDWKNGGPIKTITVHPTLPDRVGFAAYLSFISENAGDGWTVLGGQWPSPDDPWEITTPHLHVDHHTVHFAPDTGAPERVFIATDGGVLEAQDWRNPDTYTSRHNRELRTLQFYSSSVLAGFRGSIASTPAPHGLAAGGLQDNGNVWKNDNVHGIWRSSEGGDGGFNLTLGANRYLHQNLDTDLEDPDPAEPDGAVYVRRWSPPGSLEGGPPPQVPVRDATGAEIAPYLECEFEAVHFPSFRDAQGRLLHAVGWKKNSLFGLFGADDASTLFWSLLQVFVDPSTPTATEEHILSAASHDGTEILVATRRRNIFRVDPATMTDPQNMSVMGLPAGAIINRVVTGGPAIAFASFVQPGAASPLIAHRDGAQWQMASPPPPDLLEAGTGTVYGMDVDDADPASPPLLMVGSESKVWASADRAATWADVSTGLPRQPHIRELRFNRYKRRWILGSYGRSMWQAGALRQVGVSSLVQSDFPKGAEHGNFEALILLGTELFHYWKDNSDVAHPWHRGVRITDRATAPACLISSDYPKGADHRNFEALVLEGNELSHWHRDNQVDELPWIRVGLVSDDVTGPASMVQGDYRSDPDHGNFEALIPMADGLWHWFRDGATGVWRQVARVTARQGSVGCIALSDYENEPRHRALEALVFEPSTSGGGRIGLVAHYFWKPTEGRWEQTRVLTDNALGPATLIQADYAKGADHKNLEALVWMHDTSIRRPVLRHFFRRDDLASLDWESSVNITDRPSGPASLIRGNFHSDEDHGNFETIFVEQDNEIWHSYRDQSTLTWISAGSVT